MQRYYGLNIDRMGIDFTPSHAAACMACLPLGSSVLASYDERCAWTSTDYRIREIACFIAGKVLPYPWDEKDDGKEQLAYMEIEELKSILENTDWEECDG